MPEKDVYTIDIPGMTDVFRVPLPPEDDKELRKKRIERFKTKRSGLPEDLSWIPPLINMLDDAQDLLFVLLVLGKPIIRRLPSRFIPYVGWILFANDVLNILTGLFGLLAGGTGVKRVHADLVDIFSFSRPRMIQNVERFLEHTNWLGFALQAGQVLTNFTDYGLSLGAIMGCISDTVWGLIRKVQGAELEVRLPPPEDPVGKAARFLINSSAVKIRPDLFDDDDLKLISAARSGAMMVLWDQGDLTKVQSRADELANMQVPIFNPTVQASIAALEEMGIPQDTPARNIYAMDQRTTTFVQLTQILREKEQTFKEYMKYGTGHSTEVQTMLNLLQADGSLTFFDFTNNRQRNTVAFPYPWEVAYLRAVEWEIWPPRSADKWGIADWLFQSWVEKVIQRSPTSWGHVLWHNAKFIFGSYFLNLGIPEPKAYPHPRPRKKGRTPYKWNYDCLRDELGKARAGQPADFSKCIY